MFGPRNIFSRSPFGVDIGTDPALASAKRLRRNLFVLMTIACVLSAGSLIISIRFYIQATNGFENIAKYITMAETSIHEHTVEVEKVVTKGLTLQEAVRKQETFITTQYRDPSNTILNNADVIKQLVDALPEQLQQTLNGYATLPGEWIALFNGFEYYYYGEDVKLDFNRASKICTKTDTSLLGWGAQGIEERRIIKVAFRIKEPIWAGCYRPASKFPVWVHNDQQVIDSSAIMRPGDLLNKGPLACCYIDPASLYMRLGKCSSKLGVLCEKVLPRPNV